VQNAPRRPRLIPLFRRLDRHGEWQNEGERRSQSPHGNLFTTMPQIQRETHASSITEVVKNALTLYAAAIEEHKSGGHVYFKRANEGVERQLALFI
jgi:hypothetical protein